MNNCTICNGNLSDASAFITDKDFLMHFCKNCATIDLKKIETEIRLRNISNFIFFINTSQIDEWKNEDNTFIEKYRIINTVYYDGRTICSIRIGYKQVHNGTTRFNPTNLEDVQNFLLIK